MKRNEILKRILTLFYPKRCAVCDAVIAEDGGICRDCAKKVRLLTKDTCMKCGKEVAEGKTFCYDCTRKTHYFKRNFSVFVYSDIRESLYRFKYSGRAEYAKYYAKMAYELHGKQLQAIKADAIIPVPLHASRQRKRGYNQAYEVAKELSLLTQIPLRNDIIKRQKATKALKTLDVSQRQNNLKKAFLFMQNDVKLNTIILVDDIFTTGATLDEIAKMCIEHGVGEVYALTVAIGKGM